MREDEELWVIDTAIDQCLQLRDHCPAAVWKWAESCAFVFAARVRPVEHPCAASLPFPTGEQLWPCLNVWHLVGGLTSLALPFLLTEELGLDDPGVTSTCFDAFWSPDLLGDGRFSPLDLNLISAPS